MPYDTLADSNRPCLIVYLLDQSESMLEPLDGKRKIDILADALWEAIKKMVHRSAKGATIASRYKLAIYTYNDDVEDILDGVKSVKDVASLGRPAFEASGRSDAFKAFTIAEKLLQMELSNFETCPAPLVCHMTDGYFTGEDPEKVAQRLMKLGVRDGNVLVQNVYIAPDVLPAPIADPKTWPGILPKTKLKSKYAEKLRRMSSVIPESYRMTMQENGFSIQPGALMLLPGTSPQLVQMGFQMSTATRITPAR